MGANGQETSQVISSIFFVSGINTLIQTTIGDRLPIVQGGSFSYLSATFAIIFNEELINIEDSTERFETTMRTIQGAIIVSGIVQIVIGYTGIATIVLRYVSPVTIGTYVRAHVFSSSFLSLSRSVSTSLLLFCEVATTDTSSSFIHLLTLPTIAY